MAKQHAVGIDLGGTSIKAGLVDDEGTILHHARVETQADRGPEHVLTRIVRAVDAVLTALPAGERVLGVGIGAPGKVSLDRTIVSKPPNFPGWDTIDVSASLADAVPGPVIVENDANAAGLGSSFAGAGRAFDSFIMVTLGTGVGGAIIHNNRLFRGSTGGAGEIGHLSIDYEGPYARSGVAGAIEAYLGLHFLSHHARYRLLTRQTMLRSMAGSDLERLTPKMLHEAATQGDEAAIDMLAWAGHKLGCALGSVVNLLDIRKVVVGGGISAADTYILDPARTSLMDAVMPGMIEGVELVRELRGNDVGVLGAARLAFERAEDEAHGRLTA
jgi:glucokinase